MRAPGNMSPSALFRPELGAGGRRPFALGAFFLFAFKNSLSRLLGIVRVSCFNGFVPAGRGASLKFAVSGYRELGCGDKFAAASQSSHIP